MGWKGITLQPANSFPNVQRLLDDGGDLRLEAEVGSLGKWLTATRSDGHVLVRTLKADPGDINGILLGVDKMLAWVYPHETKRRN